MFRHLDLTLLARQLQQLLLRQPLQRRLQLLRQLQLKLLLRQRLQPMMQHTIYQLPRTPLRVLAQLLAHELPQRYGVPTSHRRETPTQGRQALMAQRTSAATT